MRRRRVGTSGLEVSATGLGTMTWGDGVDAAAAAALLGRFGDTGGTLVETADSYSAGVAQSVLGDVMYASSARSRLVLVARSTRPTGPSGAGRGALLAALDAALTRLRTDVVDLWQLPGWADDIPVDELLSAAQVAVMSGRARYVGLVAPSGWQLATVVERARALGPVAVPVGTQAEYSLLAREPDSELLPAAQHHGVGLLACAPLGRGVLTGKYAAGTPTGPRGARAGYVAERRTERSGRIVHAVRTAAAGLGTAPLAVALAWVRDRPGVTSAVVGVRSVAQLAAAVAADSVELPPKIRAALDDVSAPVGV